MVTINDDMLDKLVDLAKKSPRKRKNLNFHTFAADPLQRMIHAMESDTYVQPHRHINPDKRETFLVLRGRVAAIEFADDGTVDQWTVLDASAGNFAVDMAQRAWHSLIALEDGTVIYEIKDGPYNPSDDKYFAPWAPAEGDPGCLAYRDRILTSIGLKQTTHDNAKTGHTQGNP